MLRKIDLGGGYFYRTLNKDVKEINKVFLSLFSVGMILIAIFIGVSITKTSYALFSDTITGEKTIEVEVVNNKPNPPVLDSSMVPVYYDEENKTWNKADETNKSLEYKWYDYDNKMWANSITYDHTKVYNEGNTYEGKIFNGSQYVNTGNANYNFGKTITVVARFKTTKTGLSQHIISNAETAGFYLRISVPNNIVFSVYDSSSSSYKSVISTTTIEMNTWYTAVGTYDGKTLKLYINGELEASLSLTIATKISTQPLYIGGNPNASGITNETFTGTISDAIVMKDVISEEEIEEYYSEEINYQPNSNLVFNKKFGNQETYLTNANYTEEGTEFNGTTSYINAGYNDYDFGNKITVITRFKLIEYTESDIVIGNPDTAGFYININTSNLLGFVIYGENNNSYQIVNTKNEIELNKWYTVVGTYDGNTLKLYINGKLETSLSVTDTIKTSVQPIFVGANPQPNGNHIEYFTGTISDAIVINDVISEEEIKTYYSDEVNYNENENTLFYYNLRGYEGRENGSSIPMDMISTMQVWVPRYKYKVWNYNSDGTKTSNPQEIDIIFERGTKSTGEITCTDNIQGEDGDGTSEICKINGNVCIDSTCNNKYYTHPAFTFGEEELEGFWIGKFEVSSNISCEVTDSPAGGTGCNLTNITPLVKPNLVAWRGVQIGTFDKVIREMNDTLNIYNFTSNADTHVIKNREWGAISYLSHSKYGINKELESNTNSDFITGCGPQSVGSNKFGTVCNGYDTTLGKSTSTTGNIYGIYDMSGAAWNYTMSNMVSQNGKDMLSGYSQPTGNSGFTGVLYDGNSSINYTGTYSYPEEKYYDKYSFYNGEHRDDGTRKNSKLGDATKEVYNGNLYNWYNELTFSTVATSRSWVVRGGYDDYTLDEPSGAGLFSVGSIRGEGWFHTSSRMVVSIE